MAGPQGRGPGQPLPGGRAGRHGCGAGPGAGPARWRTDGHRAAPTTSPGPLSCGSGRGAPRLLVRERYAYTRWWARLLVEPVAAVAFVMSQRMLRGIRDRAERTGRPPA